MKDSSDALTFNDLLEEAQSLQEEKLKAEQRPELGPEPEEIRQFQERMKLLLADKKSRRSFQLPAGDPYFSDVSFESQMWMTMKGMEERRQDPLYFSKLQSYLERETWNPRDALLILSGVDPQAALVDWSYENFMGAELNQPKIRRAIWFTEPSDLYDYPLAADFEDSPWELKKQIRDARNTGRHLDAEKLESELRDVEQWAKDETSIYLRDMLYLRSEMLQCISRRWQSADHDPELKHSPEFFVRWAEARGFVIEWASWARQHGLIDADLPATEAPFFDADSEDYPELLHIAVRAWDHARNSENGTPKQRIQDFIKQRYPHIKEGTRDAIALVANWRKSGGRPKTGG